MAHFNSNPQIFRNTIIGRYIPYFIFHISYFIFQSPLIAQTPPKATETYQKAVKLYGEKNYTSAIKFIDEALRLDSTYAEAHLYRAYLAEILTQQELVWTSYRKAVSYRPDSPAMVVAYQKLINYNLQAGNYAQVQQDLARYIPHLKPKSVALKRAERQLQICEYAQKIIQNPLSINAEEMSDTVNRFVLQYFPCPTADNETLLFTVRKPEDDEDLYISNFQNGSWSEPKSISSNINTNDNEGTGTLSADGRTLVFTACNRRDGYGSCDLYISYRDGKEWTKPKNLGATINTYNWESQPSLSPDGRILYFASDREGGSGGRDIWYSILQAKGQWSAAKNLGTVVNTLYDEASPFMHANGHTLFFASEGHDNLGGYDLFITDSTATGWQEPRNLGYPINTSDNQVALAITSDGQWGYYSLSAKRADNQQTSRLYRFKIPESLRQQFSITNSLKGIITDHRTQKSIKADIELFDLKTNKSVSRFVSDTQDGRYTTILPNGSEWGLFVSATGYFHKSLSFDYSQKNKAEGYQLNISLEPLTTDGHGILNNIYFEVGKADLHEKSQTELNKLIQYLKIQAQLRIEIAGHTDDIGDAKQNLTLSQRRAQSVANYLIKSGIVQNRIKAIGYGKTKPIVANNSDENRRLNRRIEWRIW